MNIKQEVFKVGYTGTSQVLQAVRERVPDVVSTVVATRFASRNYYTGLESQGGVFSYDFFNSQGLNVATWILDTQTVLMQPGAEGQGRSWGLPRSETVNF